MKELSGTKHRAVDLDPLKCNDDQQSKEAKKEDQWLLVHVTSVSVFWHSSWIDFVLEWKMRKRNHGEQGSLIRQHYAISNLITKYVTHPWLLFVVADLIISKSSFLNICELVVQVQSVEAQNIRVLSFNPTCFLSPQIVILSFYPQVSFLLVSSSPSLLFYCNSFVHPSISNCFQYQLLGILLSGISPVGAYLMVTTPTHCLDNPLSSKQWSTIQHQC